MEKLYIEGNDYIPEISFNPTENTLHIKFFTQEYTEYTLEFFEPVMDWLNTYLQNPKVEKISIFICGSDQQFENLKTGLQHPKFHFQRVLDDQTI
jgi:hypothetical protein